MSTMLQRISLTLPLGRRARLAVLVTFASSERPSAPATSHARNAYQGAEYVYMKQGTLAACRPRLLHRRM